MQLDVSCALTHPGVPYAFSGPQAIAAQEIGGETVVIDGCTIWGRYMADEAGNVSVAGGVRATARAHCANCLEPAQAVVENSFDETFLRGGDPEDPEIFVYDGHTVDLDRLAMSFVVMALPMRFLCREGCPGLSGGAYSAPEAAQAGTQRPFAALEGLKTLLTNQEEV